MQNDRVVIWNLGAASTPLLELSALGHHTCSALTLHEEHLALGTNLGEIHMYVWDCNSLHPQQR